MLEKNLDLWNTDYIHTIRCITTNGFVKINGQLVMGRGCARQASEKYTWLSLELGKIVKTSGNNVYYFPAINLISFPTKHNWWEKADINLIIKSCYQLVDLIEYSNRNDPRWNMITNIYLPRPGCNNGELNWVEVKPSIEKIIDKSTIPITIVDRG